VGLGSWGVECQVGGFVVIYHSLGHQIRNIGACETNAGAEYTRSRISPSSESKAMPFPLFMNLEQDTAMILE